MEAAYTNKNFTSVLSLKEVMVTFFKENTPDTVQSLFWKVFQCWVIKDCKIKAEISDEELALFFDQLNEVIAAAYIVHQEQAVLPISQGGNSHD
jgi:hypothetical protein